MSGQDHTLSSYTNEGSGIFFSIFTFVMYPLLEFAKIKNSFLTAI